MNLPNVSNAPVIWKSIMKSYDEACDVCLRTKSKGVGSTHKAPVSTEPGQCVSFDAWSIRLMISIIRVMLVLACSLNNQPGVSLLHGITKLEYEHEPF